VRSWRFAEVATAALVAGLIVVPASARAQLVPSGPRWPRALPSGEAAGDAAERQAENPALAAVQSDDGFAWSLPGLELRGGLGPVSIGDVGRAPDPVPRALRERWLQAIERRGSEDGDAYALVRWGAAAGRGWAVEVASAAWGSARLDPDAAELLFFGNAGRTGEPRALAPDGTVDAAVLSTLTIAGAREVPSPWRGRLGLGAAAALSVGHGVWVARDAGSVASEEPPTLTLRFPMLERRPEAHAGSGGALHLGAVWEDDRWSAGITAHDVVARFTWSRDGMTLRPGEAVLGPDAPDVDNTPRPASEAPAALLAALDSLRPARGVTLSVARRLNARTRVAAELMTRARGGIASGPRTAATLAAEWKARPALPLRAAAQVGGGLALGIAAEPALGRWVIGLEGSLGVAGARRDASLTLGLRRARGL
jgi:hypothetical protein